MELLDIGFQVDLLPRSSFGWCEDLMFFEERKILRIIQMGECLYGIRKVGQSQLFGLCDPLRSVSVPIEHNPLMCTIELFHDLSHFEYGILGLFEPICNLGQDIGNSNVEHRIWTR